MTLRYVKRDAVKLLDAPPSVTNGNQTATAHANSPNRPESQAFPRTGLRATVRTSGHESAPVLEQ